MNICSGVCAWATIRISSSTASTLAMPARKIAWLSAKISLSILSSLQNLGVPHELIRVDHAGHTSALVASFIRAHYPPFALDGYILFASGNLRRQCDFKFHGRTHLQSSVSANVNPGGAEIAGYSLGVAAGVVLMNLDG